MERVDIINTIGRTYLTTSAKEKDEFDYPKEFKKMSIPFTPIVKSGGQEPIKRLTLDL